MGEIFQTGAILESSETDYPAGGMIIIPDKPFYRFEDQRKSYNQAIKDSYGCCRYGAATSVANNRGVDWTEEDWQWFRDNATNYGWAPVQGMKVGRGGDMVVDRLNIKFPGEGRTKYVVSTNTTEADDLRSKGWMIHIGSFVNQSYRDQIHTGKITSVRGKDGGGHSRSMFDSISTKLPYIEENYQGRIPYDTIEIDVRQNMKDSGELYNQGFIYYPTHQMIPEIPVKYNTGVTPVQQEIVHAREKIITDGRKPLFVIYTDDSYINRMEIDIGISRAKARGDI